MLYILSGICNTPNIFVCFFKIDFGPQSLTFGTDPRVVESGLFEWNTPIKLVCALSQDCFDRLSLNFVKSLVLLMGGSLLILGKIDYNMATRGRFCKTQLSQCDAKYHKACFKCLQMFPLCFSNIFYLV